MYPCLSVVKKQWKPLMNTEADYCRTPLFTQPTTFLPKIGNFVKNLFYEQKYIDITGELF